MSKAKLTIEKIREMIKGDDRIDQVIERDQDTVTLFTAFGWAFDAREDRHVEVLKIGDFHPDSVDYLEHCLRNIERDGVEALEEEGEFEI